MEEFSVLFRVRCWTHDVSSSISPGGGTLLLLRWPQSNMTDLYRCEWRRKWTANATREEKRFPLSVDSGGLSLFVHQMSPSVRINASFAPFWADMAIRKSRFETDNGFLLRIHGLYWESAGVLLGVANPHEHSAWVVENVMLDLHPRSTPADVVRQLAALPTNVTRDPLMPASHSSPHKCYYVMAANVFSEEVFAEPEWKRQLGKKPRPARRLVGLAAPYLVMQGVLISPNCNLELHFNGKSVYLNEGRGEARNYAFVTLILGAASYLGLLRQLERSSSTMRASKVSSPSALLAAGMDFYMGVLHFVSFLCLSF